MDELAQLLFAFSEQMESKPVHPGDVPADAPPEKELRSVKRRKGDGILPTSISPVTRHVYELSAEQRACSCCGTERKEIGADESWQVEYHPGHFERLQHVRKKYACPACEKGGESPQIETAAKPEAVIDKGMAGRDCWPSSSPASSPTIFLSTGWRIFQPARLRDLARHAIVWCGECGRPGRAAVRTDGGACARLSCCLYR